MQRQKRMTRSVTCDNAPFLHERFAGKQAALPIFVIDQRQPLLISIECIVPAAGHMGINDLSNTVWITSASHGSGSTGFQIRQQRNTFLTIPWTFDRVPSNPKKFSQFRRSARRLDFE